ncbi:transglutaminase family protein [Metaclostridioides mangenotii]|uniref:transglutaminase-like domain-containing protein n=1 Tax=Metaclostridioides mangenotii TaxID=1540 RepID=UPI0028E4E860|nr:transglutaminase family protein [Clostridioides mangenotii]
MKKYLLETNMLNYKDKTIQELIRKKRWDKLSDFEKIKQIYMFIRDDIKFGYNVDDNIPASKVLIDYYGQCNTKGTLFMALLRAVDIPCRLHGFTIDKNLQKGVMTGFIYRSAPSNILHSWVEVFYNDKWYNLEGFILDKTYLVKLQEKYSECTTSFCGFGVAIDNFKNPVIDWNENDTYIQKNGINKDFGVYNSPDDFFSEHSQNLNKVKLFLYRNCVRHLMNKKVNSIRNK